MYHNSNTPFNVLGRTRPINETATVATPSFQYTEMAKKWELVETLRGGNDAMRAAGEKYLPRQPKESKEAYNQRLNMTMLFNLYWRTLQSISGLAFIKPVVVSNVPPELEYLEANADGTGRSITEIAYEMAIDSLQYGKTHAIADFPMVDTEELSLAEFRASGFRPYFTVINPTNVLGWRTSESPGTPVLQQVRVIDHKIVPSDVNEWAEKDVYFVRVIHANFTEIYEYDPEATDTSYQLVNVVENTLGYIPLTTAYSNKTGFMTSQPAMYDLAQVNLRHYQSSSDQTAILHHSRVPILGAFGFDEGELDNVEIGPNRMLVSSNENADIKYIEHTGRAIGAGRQDLIDLENQMSLLGADLLVSKGVSRMTASARRLDQDETMSILQLALRSIEQSIERLYRIAGDWLGVDASEVKVSIGDDMSLVSDPNPVNSLISFYKETGVLTEDQLVEEAQRQGILSGYFKLDENRPSQQEGFGEDLSSEPVEEEEEENQQQ